MGTEFCFIDLTEIESEDAEGHETIVLAHENVSDDTLAVIGSGSATSSFRIRTLGEYVLPQAADELTMITTHCDKLDLLLLVAADQPGNDPAQEDAGMSFEVLL